MKHIENVNWTVRNPNLQEKIKSEHFFYFFLIFEDFTVNKTELPTLKNQSTEIIFISAEK